MACAAAAAESQVAEEFLEEIKRELAPSECQEAYKTLAKILRNILRSPEEPKYRLLKKESRAVAQQICVSTGAVSLLLCVGFEDQGEAFHCDLSVDLEQMRVASELLENMTMNLDVLEGGAASSSAIPSGPTGDTSPLSQPPPATTAAPFVPLRRVPKAEAEAEKQRKEQAAQLQALRESQKSRHAASQEEFAAFKQQGRTSSGAATATGGHVLGGTPAASTASASASAPLPDLSVNEDLITLEPQQPSAATAEFAELLPGFPAEPSARVEEREPRQQAQRPAPPTKTLYDFAKRADTEASPDAAATKIDDVRQLQKERYARFRSDPSAQQSEAYARPPSGVLDESQQRQQGATATSPSGSGWTDWFAGTSKQVSEASERLSAGFSDVSKRVSSEFAVVSDRLTAQAQSAWGGGTSPSASSGDNVPLPSRFRVTGRGGAMVRQGVEKDSDGVDMLRQGSEFTGLELRRSQSGTRRLRLEEPLTGWVSYKEGVVERKSAPAAPTSPGGFPGCTANHATKDEEVVPDMDDVASSNLS